MTIEALSHRKILFRPMDNHKPIAKSKGSPRVELALISFLILFFELTCIRWFAGGVIYLTFFTNIVLMACFLGMSIGCLTASRKENFIKWVIPLTLFAVHASMVSQRLVLQFAGKVSIDVGRQSSPQEIFFGTEPIRGDASALVIPIEVLAGFFFVMIALMFVGLGQELGRRFNAIPNRIGAYTINVAGSLAGIAAFGLASYSRLTPLHWFAISGLLCFMFLKRATIFQIGCLVVLLVLTGVASNTAGNFAKVIWSPYYKVEYEPTSGDIITNNIGHQTMLKKPDGVTGYALAHLLNSDTGGTPFKDVMVIGAGSGNDVAAALGHGAERVDAVEIEPVLNEIGRERHPDRPYDNPKVHIHLDDGRNFVRQTDRKFDLAVYALVDSLVLHSGYSSLRLESFLFTEQAFRDIKSRLNRDGVFVMYNFYRQGWVVGRLAKMAETVFGVKPVVISLPYAGKIGSEDSQQGSITFLMVGLPGSKPLEAVRKRFEQDKFFWVQGGIGKSLTGHAFGEAPPAGSAADTWTKYGPAEVGTASIDLLPSDDWPFLYLRKAEIPWLNIRGIALIGGLSLALLWLFSPAKVFRPNGQMLFLGAGFMLLETKGVVHLALLFGSTWVVNSIVFAAILVMILLANLYTAVVKPKTQWPFYVLLAIGLVVNIVVPMDVFLGLPGVLRVLTSCLVVFAPVMFAGVIFAMAFRDSTQPDIDFGSNIAGVIVGGLAEYFSLMLGFNHLLLVALAFYALSGLLKPGLLSKWTGTVSPTPAAA